MHTYNIVYNTNGIRTKAERLYSSSPYKEGFFSCNQDPSYKMDLDFPDCFGRESPVSYKNRRNMINIQLFLCFVFLYMYLHSWCIY